MSYEVYPKMIMKENIPLRVMSPQKVDEETRALIRFLELDESTIVLLVYSAPIDFKPEPQNCHFNVWVKCDKADGKPQHGWILAQDKAQAFVEAQFHTVWCSPHGELQDVTPRADGEKFLMFIPDFTRRIELSDHQGSPAIITYDNVRIHQGRVVTGLTRAKLVPQSEMIYEYGLAIRPKNS